MEKIEAVVFDLDGTLTDSKKNIYESVIAALKDLNVKQTIKEEEFDKYIGLTFHEIFEDLGIDTSVLDFFFDHYKKHYYELLHLTNFYDGAVDTLKYLSEEGIKVCLLTTKAQDQADYIIDQLDVRKYFTYVMGRRPDVANKPSPEPLLKISDEIKTDIKNCVMVGDTEMDINCGKSAGAISVGVTYGYRSKEHVKSLNPDFVIEDIKELKVKLGL